MWRARCFFHKDPGYERPLQPYRLGMPSLCIVATRLEKQIHSVYILPFETSSLRKYALHYTLLYLVSSSFHYSFNLTALHMGGSRGVNGGNGTSSSMPELYFLWSISVPNSCFASPTKILDPRLSMLISLVQCIIPELTTLGNASFRGSMLAFLFLCILVL